MRMRKQMMNIYQPTTLCAKLFHRHRYEPMLAEDHAWCTGADRQPTSETLDYDSHHVLTPRLARALPGGLGN